MSLAAPTASPPAVRWTRTTAISYVAGSLTVTPAPLTITANNQTKVYGAALPTLTASYSGFVNGDTLGQPDDPAHADDHGHGQQPVAGSPYSITASGAVDTDYSISYVGGQLTVTPAPLTITADNQTKVYGAALPTLTASYSGLRQRRHLGQPDHPAHADDHGHGQQPRRGSPYTITASGAVDTDYSISYVGRHADGHPGAADDHGEQPDQGLRRGSADAHGQLLRASSTATPRPA